MASMLRNDQGEKKASRWNRLSIGRALVINFFMFVVLFQVFLISKFPPLYTLLKVLFLIEMGLLVWGFVEFARKTKGAILVVLLVVAIRIPFYLQGNGLMFTTDNALEAIQSLEMQQTHTAPVYLLSAIGHNGVLKHLMVAFVWDVLGTSYLTFVLFQTLIYLVFLYLLYAIGRRWYDERAVGLLILGQFAFIEVFFDYSLFLRAAPYFEMLVVFVLGVALFDFQFRHAWRNVGAMFFVMTAVYINPAAWFLVVPFVVTVLIQALVRRAPLRSWGYLAGGLLAGSGILFYRRFFLPAPPFTKDWFRVRLLSLSDVTLARIPGLLTQFFKDAADSFHNLMAYEFRFSYYTSPYFKFDPEPPAFRSVLGGLASAAEFLAVAVFATAFVLVIRRLWLGRKDGFRSLAWIYMFFVILFLGIAGRIILLSPKPFVEPRHNLDLALLLIFSFFIVGDVLIRRFRPTLGRGVVVVVLLLLLALPSGFYFLKTARFKSESYPQILTVLRDHGVRYLAADFTIAYALYFLSHQQIQVTDSIGPVIMDIVKPEMRLRVDEIPDDRKAYLYMTTSYPRVNGIRVMGERSKYYVLTRLRSERIAFKIVNLGFYELIIPDNSRLDSKPSY
jgi:hypothetical protein